MVGLSALTRLFILEVFLVLALALLLGIRDATGVAILAGAIAALLAAAVRAYCRVRRPHERRRVRRKKRRVNATRTKNRKRRRVRSAGRFP